MRVALVFDEGGFATETAKGLPSELVNTCEATLRGPTFVRTSVPDRYTAAYPYGFCGGGLNSKTVVAMSVYMSRIKAQAE